MSKDITIPSSIATGGGGEHFEQHVGAFALALLLVRGYPPILSNTSVIEVHFQTRHLGWMTDDLLVIGETGTGEKRALACQVKRSLTIASANEDCRATFAGMWDDFVNTGRFNTSSDRLAVITLHGTSTLLHSFNSLLDCARASLDASDFFRRLELDGYISNKAKQQHEALQTILENHTGMAVARERYWRFLCVVHILSFDFNTSTAQTEAWARSLLSHFVIDSPDPVTTARNTWAGLLECVGLGRPSAASYEREDLPSHLLERHSAISGTDSRALLALIEHGHTVRNAVRSKLGDNVEVDRTSLAVSMLELLSEYQVVLVSGKAGSGKSVLVKNAMKHLHDDRPILAFQAVEFAVAHIDEALRNAQTSLNAQRLFALLAAQDRKVIMIESVERLLEHSVRDAFTHLLQLAGEDRYIQLILTCRDYSLETVRSSLLEPVGLHHTVFEVPAFTAEELRQVEIEIPTLSSPLHDTRMRSLLRTPYLLDMATRLDWAGGPLPQSERAFREKCWRELIRDDSFSAHGMPQRREKAFVGVARCRARELRPYIVPEGTEPEALDALRRDGIIIFSENSPSLVAPAHDVLEDWAIIHWLEEQFVTADDPHSVIAENVGGFPALRRGYRRWLSERFETEPETAHKFVLDALDHTQLLPFFRDDSLVCALLSESAEDFVENCRSRLFVGESALLTQVVHILRVACKESPRWLDVPGLPSQLMVPKGTGWAATLRVVAGATDRLLPEHRYLVLGLVEDWARQVDWQNTSPPGSEAAGKIAVALLPHFNDYRSDDALKRALEVLLKVPSTVAPEFTALMERAQTRDHHDCIAEALAELILGSPSSFYACRDFPTAVIDLTNARFRMEEDDIEDEWRSSRSGVDKMFGLCENVEFNSFPASALKGPFRALLRLHPHKAISFIIDLLNHAGEWYGMQRWPGRRLEPAWQITIEIPEEASICQWMNERLYNLFRGISVGPYVLQSALMALESWLLDISRVGDVNFESWLLHILRESNNVMATGVVASVCMAHPEKAGRASLALLSSRDLVRYDLHRCVTESMSSLNYFTGVNLEDRIYQEERKKSNALEHRREALEHLAIRMQFMEYREEVWRIIDRHRHEILLDQDENDKLWRLALHRIDVRGFQPVETPEELLEVNPKDATGRLDFGPNEIEPDIQELVDERTAIHNVIERHMRLQNRSRSAWEEPNSEEAVDWHELLAEAQVIEAEAGEPDEHMRSGPGLVAAICIRDHLDELDEQQLDWCRQRIELELRRDSVAPNEMIRVVQGLFQPDRAAASVVPLLLVHQEETYDPSILALLAIALTHPVQEVVSYANVGVGLHMGEAHRELVFRCVAAAAQRARLSVAFREQQQTLPYDEQARGHELIDHVVPAVREAFEKGTLELDAELSALDIDDWTGEAAARTIIEIFAYYPQWGESRAFYARIASWLTNVWDRARSSQVRSSRNFELEYDARRYIANFVLKLPEEEAMRICASFFDAVSRHPSETAGFVTELVVKADSGSNDCFWELWQQFAERAMNASWHDSFNQEHAFGETYVKTIFLTYGWKEGVTHWHRLQGNAHRIEELAQRLPAVRLCLLSYAKFLYTIGQQSLPAAFVIIDSMLERGEDVVMVSDSDTIFYLETLLRRYVYTEPHRLKSDTKLRKSVLNILDVLVAGGSSAAYRLRDDFVTPLGAIAQGHQ